MIEIAGLGAVGECKPFAERVPQRSGGISIILDDDHVAVSEHLEMGADRHLMASGDTAVRDRHPDRLASHASSLAATPLGTCPLDL